MSFLKRLFGLEKPAPAPAPRDEVKMSTEGAERVEAAAIPCQLILEARTPGFSRIGGTPLVPTGFVWPTEGQDVFSFLMQLDLSEVNDKRLPSDGYLYFFDDVATRCRVIYVRANPEDLHEMAPPPSKQDRGFKPLPIRFEEEACYPHWDSDEFRAMGLSDEDADAYEREEYGRDPGDHLLGHAYPVQEHTMQEEAHQAFPGVSKSPSEWKLLLQLGNIDEIDLYWGDGDVYYWIRAEDLANRNFDRVFVVLQFT